jgi:hypothetical protein
MLLVKTHFGYFAQAELGFFGVVVYTRVQTPRRCGQAFKRAAFAFVLHFFAALAHQLINGRHTVFY